MGSKITRTIRTLVAMMFLLMSLQAGAQGTTSEMPGGAAGPRKQMATIIFAGLAGAILGLSTLSFYGRPQDKLSNIAVGFAVGVIIGTSYTTYQAATKPYERYDFQGDGEFSPSEGLFLAQQKAFTPKLNFQWEF